MTRSDPMEQLELKGTLTNGTGELDDVVVAGGVGKPMRISSPSVVRGWSARLVLDPVVNEAAGPAT